MEGVVKVVCDRLDIPFVSCRGYTSATSMWQNAQMLKEFSQEGLTPVILHLGDHDPSGIDMSRDIEERVRLYMDGEGDSLVFTRIALNMDQVKKYKPPENPAKVTDSRYDDYVTNYGESSWELDALSPAVIDDLIMEEIGQYLDSDRYEDLLRREKTEKALLNKCSDRWPAVAKMLNKK